MPRFRLGFSIEFDIERDQTDTPPYRESDTHSSTERASEEYMEPEASISLRAREGR